MLMGLSNCPLTERHATLAFIKNELIYLPYIQIPIKTHRSRKLSLAYALSGLKK